MHVSIEQFADEAGVSATIISKRIRKGEIKAEAIVIGGRLRFMIDTSKHVPKDHRERKGGRPAKAKK